MMLQSAFACECVPLPTAFHGLPCVAALGQEPCLAGVPHLIHVPVECCAGSMRMLVGCRDQK